MINFRITALRFWSGFRRYLIERFVKRCYGIIRYIWDNSIVLVAILYLGFLLLGWWNLSVVTLILVLSVVGAVIILRIRFAPKIMKFLLLIIAATGFVAINVGRSKYYKNRVISELKNYVGEQVNFYGYICEEPDYGHDTVNLVFCGDVVDEEGSKISVNNTRGFRIISRFERFPRKKLGDSCNVYGVLERPQSFAEFDYAAYLENKGIYHTMNYVELNCDGRRGNGIRNFLFDLKSTIVMDLQKKLPEPQASLLIGILLGEDRVFEDSFEKSLRVSGTTHIIAASGYNITLIVLAINRVLIFFDKKLRMALTILLIWAFCLLSGFSASIVRAGIMSTISIIGLLFGYKGEIHSILPMTAFIYALFDPRIVFDVGFQLSLAATLGLVYIVPVLKKFTDYLVQLPGLIGKVWTGIFTDDVLATISCTISTMPISILSFGQFSVVSIICNMLVLPVLESTMFVGLLGYITGLVKAVLPGVSEFLFLVTWVQLKYFEEAVRLLGSLEFVSFELSGDWVKIVVYGLSFIIGIICFCEYEGEEEGYYQSLFEKELGHVSSNN